MVKKPTDQAMSHLAYFLNMYILSKSQFKASIDVNQNKSNITNIGINLSVVIFRLMHKIHSQQTSLKN